MCTSAVGAPSGKGGNGHGNTGGIKSAFGQLRRIGLLLKESLRIKLLAADEVVDIEVVVAEIGFLLDVGVSLFKFGTLDRFDEERLVEIN